MANILVVDDDAEVRTILEVMLRAQGHEVRVAGTADEALLASADRRAELLLLDLCLEGRRGDELIQMLDRGIGRPQVLCLLSGAPESELARLSALHGVHYLHKPIDPVALQRVVASVEGPPVPVM